MALPPNESHKGRISLAGSSRNERFVRVSDAQLTSAAHVKIPLEYQEGKKSQSTVLE